MRFQAAHPAPVDAKAIGIEPGSERVSRVTPFTPFTEADIERHRRFLATEGMSHALVLLECGLTTGDLGRARTCLERANRARSKALLYCSGTCFTMTECGRFDWLSNCVDNCMVRLEERLRKAGQLSAAETPALGGKRRRMGSCVKLNPRSAKKLQADITAATEPGEPTRTG